MDPTICLWKRWCTAIKDSKSRTNLSSAHYYRWGKGQLSSSLKALEKLELRGKIAIVGIAKRLEEIYFPGDSVPLYIDKRSES